MTGCGLAGEEPRPVRVDAYHPASGGEPDDVPLSRGPFPVTPPGLFPGGRGAGPLGEPRKRFPLVGLGHDRRVRLPLEPRQRISGRSQELPQRHVPGIHVTQQEDPEVLWYCQVR